MISIVMSCYNAQDTIEKAIRSVLDQSYKDIELIVVNDCSTDNSVEIVKSLMQNDSRIRLINHNVNKGAGIARRAGVENIKGEYMTFLDSDDYLKKNCLKKLYDAAKHYNVDIIAPGYIIVNTNYTVIDRRVPKKSIQTGSDKYKRNTEDTKRFMNPMLIKASLWDNVTYSDRRFIEDTPTLVQILYYANSILMLDYAGYYYVQNKDSLTHTCSSIKYEIFRLLALKDVLVFFNSVCEHISYSIFINQYNNFLDMDITEEEYILYKKELDELYEFYNSHV